MVEFDTRKTLLKAVAAMTVAAAFGTASAGELDDAVKKLLSEKQAQNRAARQAAGSTISVAEKQNILNSSPTLKKFFAKNKKKIQTSAAKRKAEKADKPATLDEAVSAQSAVVLDGKTEKLLYSRNAFKRMAPASLTKIMTALVVLEACDDISRPVTIKRDIKVREDGVAIGLKAGDKTTLEDLLYMAMLYSANDACVAIAEEVGGSVEDFAKIMNKKAKDIGAVNSNFVNPNGMPHPNHFSNAYDMAIISNYAMKLPGFAKIVGTKSKKVQISTVKEIVKRNKKEKTVTKQLVRYTRDISLTNRHKLLGKVEGVHGIKTGYTKAAGRCLATAYSDTAKDVVVIVLKAKDVAADTMALINSDKFPQSPDQVASKPVVPIESPLPARDAGRLDSVTLSTITRNN